MNYDPGEDYSELSPLPRGFKIFLLVMAAALLASAILCSCLSTKKSCPRYDGRDKTLKTTVK